MLADRTSNFDDWILKVAEHRQQVHYLYLYDIFFDIKNNRVYNTCKCEKRGILDPDGFFPFLSLLEIHQTVCKGKKKP